MIMDAEDLIIPNNQKTWLGLFVEASVKDIYNYVEDFFVQPGIRTPHQKKTSKDNY